MLDDGKGRSRMKITFVIPSPEFLASAGARIRYLRMLPLAEKAGHEIQLVPIANWATLDDPGDVIIFSKCFDARAIVAAAKCRREGRTVGVDLFDDYFTQSSDSRMTLYRTWLDQILQHAQFAVCSTARMASVVTERSPGFPTHIFNDPASDIRESTLPQVLAAKRENALASKRISLAWFGIGDNPFFSVGLDDLAAFGGQLTPLLDRGWEIELTVLTNARSLSADRIVMLKCLPFPVKLEIWSENRESELLLDSLCCFLPVNAQPFSIAKSLNRAVSALTAGCQVIWAGYPLYEQLGPLIYADPEHFASDLESGTLRHSPQRFETYLALLRRLADLENEVDGFLHFLTTHRSLGTDSNSCDQTATSAAVLVLVHGLQTNGEAHKAAQRDGILSVGTPFSPPSLTYDVLFFGRIAGGDLDMLISEQVMPRLLPGLADRTQPFGRVNKRDYRLLSFKTSDLRECFDQNGGSINSLHFWAQAPLPVVLAAYAGIFAKVKAQLQAAFGPVNMIISESSKLPLDPAVPPSHSDGEGSW